MKLSKRLTQIENLITADYDHIWDTCCDHGLLGASLISQQKARNIHLVDIVPDLVTTLNAKLIRLFANPYAQRSTSRSPTHWQTHCLDVSELPLHQHTGKHLVIIAGIGGDLMIECVQKIIAKNPTLTIDFILCPVRQLYTLRQQLIALNAELKDEVLIKENKIFYEILFLSVSPNTTSNIAAVSPTGDRIWQGQTKEEKEIAKEYLQLNITHYQKMLRGRVNANTSEVLAAYQAVTITL